MKKTKSKLFITLLCMVLLLTMFIGTTYAWFTDSVSNTGNRIESGRLSIDLVMYKEVANSDPLTYSFQSIANGSGDIFDEASVSQNSNKTLWEPGKTQVVFLGIRNKGTLALNYQIYLDVTDYGLCDIESTLEEDSSLEYVIVPLGKDFDTVSTYISNFNTVYTNWESIKGITNTISGDVLKGRKEIKTGVLDEIANTPSIEEETEYFALAVHMKEDAGNDYQDKYCIIDVNLVASQEAIESDSFDNTYDTNSEKLTVPEKITDVSNGSYSNNMTTFEANVTPLNESNKKTIVEIPNTVVGFDGTSSTSLAVEAYPTLASSQKFEVVSGTSAVGAIDLTVKVNGEEVTEFKDSENNPIEVTVSTYVAKNLTGVVLKYNGKDGKSDPTDVTYDSTTGLLTFKTTHFSQYLLGANEAFYLVDTNMAYLTFNEAMDVAGTTKSTIALLKDVNDSFNSDNLTYSTSGSGDKMKMSSIQYTDYIITEGKDITLDLNGHTFKMWDKTTAESDITGISEDVKKLWDNAYSSSKTSLKTFGIQIDSNAKFTIDDSSEESNGKIYSSNTGYRYDRLIYPQSGSTFTMKNGTAEIVGAYACYFNGATVESHFNMLGGSLIGGYYGFYASGSSINELVCNVSGGTISGTGGENHGSNGSSAVSCALYGVKTFNMTGGTIGGVYEDDCSYSSGLILQHGTANISGGNIISYYDDSDEDNNEANCLESFGSDSVINLSGNVTLTGNGTQGYLTTGGIINVYDGATFNTTNSNAYAWYVYPPAGGLNIYGGTFKTTVDKEYMIYGTATISGGSFTSDLIANSLVSGKILQYNSETKLYDVVDGTYALIFDNKGYETKEAGDLAIEEKRATLDSAYDVYKTGTNKYQTLKTADLCAQVGDCYFTDASSAIKYANESGLTVTLLQNLDSTLSISNDVTIDLSGFYLLYSGNMFEIQEGKTLTLLNSGSTIPKTISYISYGTLNVGCAITLKASYNWSSGVLVGTINVMDGYTKTSDNNGTGYSGRTMVFSKN